jgi:hypothetical protein
MFEVKLINLADPRNKEVNQTFYTKEYYFNYQCKDIYATDN